MTRQLRRRLIPPFFAILCGLAALSPLVTDWPGEKQTNTWTLFALTAMFAFKAGLFWWMRERMHDGIRKLTRFGAALVDFFTALVICDVALVLVFSVAYFYARERRLSPFWLRLVDRSALIVGVALVISTGVAVAFEMRKAGTKLRVHEEDEWPMPPLDPLYEATRGSG